MARKATADESAAPTTEVAETVAAAETEPVVVVTEGDLAVAPPAEPPPVDPVAEEAAMTGEAPVATPAEGPSDQVTVTGKVTQQSIRVGEHVVSLEAGKPSVVHADTMHHLRLKGLIE